MIVELKLLTAGTNVTEKKKENWYKIDSNGYMLDFQSRKKAEHWQVDIVTF